MMLLKRTLALLLCALTLGAALCGAVLADGEDKIVVVLDPGHGGKDVGAVGEKYEEYYNLKVALYCAEKLRENGGFDVYLTRETEEDGPSLLERALIADEVNADVLVSMHFNGNTDKDMSGAYVYSSVLDRFDLTALADKTLEKIAEASGIEAKGCRRTKDDAGYYWDDEHQWDVQSDEYGPQLSDYYGVITWAAKFGFPSMIIEHAFVTNEDDAKIINDDENLKKIGEADADALIEYFTGHEHVYGQEPIVDQPVSCVSAGKRSYHCTVCGHRKDVGQIADAPDGDAHFWVKESVTPASCVAEGSENYYCRYERNLAERGYEGVADNVKSVAIPKTDHDYELKSVVEPTEGKDGTKVYVCTVCGDTRVESITFEARQTELAEAESVDRADVYRLAAIVAICVAAVAVIAAAILAVLLAKRSRAYRALLDGTGEANELLVEVASAPDAPAKSERLSPIAPNGKASEAIAPDGADGEAKDGEAFEPDEASGKTP